METSSMKSGTEKTEKRTRTNVKQSKYGCFTCKKRRVKCDEAKPSCRRCFFSKVSCLGYPPGSPPGPSLVTSSSAVVSAPARNLDFPLNRYVYLACTVLSQGPRRAKSDPEVAFWNFAVPQMIHSVPSVRAAAAAFGASYDEYMLKSNRTGAGLVTTRQYHQALLSVQNEVSELRHGSLPCMTACLLMAFTEVLQQRSDRAYVHLQGAFAIMAARTNKTTKTLIEDEDISAMFEKLNLHSATYALSRSLDSSPPKSDSTRSISLPPERNLSRILHSCYSFVSAALRYKYANPMLIPSNLFFDQGRVLGNLQQWLTDHQLDPIQPMAHRQNEQLLVLRAQCLAGLIHVSNVLQPYETSYDSYELEFQEIIASAEAVFEIRTRDEKSQIDMHALPLFTPEMGIIQPVFLTALKYRHPFWRRKALDLLQKSGREGPWSGPREARILEIVIAVEEALESPNPDMEKLEKPNIYNPSDVPEQQRVHLCWVVDYLDRRQQSISRDQGAGSPAQFAKIQLCKHLNLDAIMSDETRGPCGDSWLDQEYWHSWFKTAPLPE